MTTGSSFYLDKYICNLATKLLINRGKLTIANVLGQQNLNETKRQILLIYNCDKLFFDCVESTSPSII